jgi:hypothetical protein
MKLRMRDSPVSKKFNSLQTRRPHLIETKYVENRVLSRRPETALGAVDRFWSRSFFSDTYKIDHLSKQQVVAYDTSAVIAVGDFASGTRSCTFLRERTLIEERDSNRMHHRDFSVRLTVARTCSFRRVSGRLLRGIPAGHVPAVLPNVRPAELRVANNGLQQASSFANSTYPIRAA